MANTTEVVERALGSGYAEAKIRLSGVSESVTDSLEISDRPCFQSSVYTPALVGAKAFRRLGA